MHKKPITISGNEFNEKIKNNLRDYYIYQFKRFQKNDTSDYRKKGTDEFKPASTFTEEKQRLLAMLERHAQIEWIVEKGGVCCCSVDTRSLETNPFWEPYRFCTASPRYIGWFLNMVLFLHPQMQLRSPDGSIEPVLPQILRKFRPETTLRLKTMSRENLQDWLHRQVEELYTDQNWGDLCLERYLALFRQRINGRKMVLEDDPECFGLPRELLQRYYLDRWSNEDICEDQFKNRLDSVCSGIFRSKRISQRREQWRLSRNMLNLPPENEDLRFRFQQMTNFFSQTLPLGFVGLRLQQRAGAVRKLIRYKHNYIIKSLNDYNIADLLHAIGQDIWLCVEFRNGTKLQYQKMVCLPLQIRESTQDGRQYLMYYHPGYRSLGSLRLDFIDKITYGTVEECPHFSEEIALAREMLQTIWGCSVPGFAKGNLIHLQKSAHIRLVIQRDRAVTENRLRREARHGRITAVDKTAKTLTYEVDVADPGEMIPWIRSFSSRVLEIWADDTPCHPCVADPTTELRTYLNKQSLLYADLPDRHTFRDDVKFRPQKKQRYPHEYLFTPLFGVFFDTVVQTVFELMQFPGRKFSTDDLTERIRRIWPAAFQLQEDMLENILENITILCSGSTQDGYRLNYIPTEEYRSSCRSFWDMIPLSDLEASYLKGILLHNKARLFLSEQEIDRILSGLEESVEPISFASVYYHDQHCDVTPCYETDAVRKNFAALMDSAAGGKALDTVYESQLGRQTPSLTVLHLEYSKREDRFRALCADADSCISFRNLERFVSISPSESFTDPQQLQLAADADAAKNSKRLVLTFSDERNRAERIATEFSPWKKICTSHLENGVPMYVMELFYDARDASEIAVRLLSYGKGISVTHDNGDAAHQLELRRYVSGTAG